MKLFFIFASVLLLHATTPVIFQDFGDPLYNNALKLDKFKSIVNQHQRQKITIYLQELEKVKNFGIGLSLDDKKSKKKYFALLRKLALENDYYVRLAHQIFILSVQNNSINSFLNLLETGLINKRRNKEIIDTFYKKNKEEMILKGIYTDEMQKYKELFKGIGEKEKISIDKIRTKDLQEQYEIQKKLEKAIKNLK